MKRNHSLFIYASKRHLWATMGFVSLPFLFLIVFSIITDFSLPKLFLDMGISSLRLFIAYIIAAAMGWILAVLFYKGRRADVSLPLFDVLQSFPTFATLPLGVVIFGKSDALIVTFLVITVIWPILFSTISSLKLIKRDWQDVTEIIDLSGFDYLRKFLWPASIPGLITGSIIGLGEGWEALVATEMIVHINTGLGSFFQEFSSNPGITAIGIFGLLLFIFVVNKLLWLPLLERGHRMMED